MKTMKDKEILVGADFAGFLLKEAVVEHLQKYGWKVTDVGVKKDSNPDDTDLMFHRIGLRVGSMITEKEFERALIFCGTGMGIHIAASKCPGVHAGVVESVPAALRATTEEFQEKLKEAGVDLSAGNIADFLPQLGSKSELRPADLYEAMLLLIAEYKIAGVLWYQGESDGAIVEGKTARMISDRHKF